MNVLLLLARARWAHSSSWRLRKSSRPENNILAHFPVPKHDLACTKTHIIDEGICDKVPQVAFIEPAGVSVQKNSCPANLLLAYVLYARTKSLQHRQHLRILLHLMVQQNRIPCGFCQFALLIETQMQNT